MKLLGWMHRKFRQNNTGEPFKDLALGYSCNCLAGQPSLDEQKYLPTPIYGSKSPRNHQKDMQLRKSFTGVDSVKIEEEFDDYQHSDDTSGFFDGLLTIGTFGSDSVASEPQTPTFATLVEGVTENEMKFINEELEKVLAADVKEEKCNDSSGRSSHVSTGRNSHVSTGRTSHVSTGRTSHVSTGRTSHASTITLSGADQISARNSSSVCPLQGYLFGSPIDLPEQTTVGKKENRTSLGELFQRSKMAEEKSDKEDKREGERSAKKILKWPSLRSSSSGNGTADSTAAENKLQKLLHIFNRKVHPEITTATITKRSKNKSNKKHENQGANCSNDVDRSVGNEDIMLFPQAQTQREPMPKERVRRRRHKSHSNPPPFTLSDSNGNKECWIKTDADYLVLEL